MELQLQRIEGAMQWLQNEFDNTEEFKTQNINTLIERLNLLCNALPFINNQMAVAKKQLNKAKVFPGPLATQLSALDSFHAAESYHQNYLANHPNEPYIVYNDMPKLAKLRKEFPELYKE